MSGKLQIITSLFDVRYFNSSSTFKTSLGFMKTLFSGDKDSSALSEIFNYVPIDEQIATAGQPKAGQFNAIKAAGFTKIINLAPHKAENAIEDEDKLVAGLGLEYVHIPVDFKNPTEADYQKFVAELSQSTGKTFVHCAANMRVSAFMYRYRVGELKEDEVVVRRDMENIWKPFGVWEAFVNRAVG